VYASGYNVGRSQDQDVIEVEGEVVEVVRKPDDQNRLEK
jgi:hypothetical protein